MPAPIDDDRLTTDPDDAVTTQQHKASTSSSQPRMLSQIGLSQALQRWKTGEHGPQSREGVPGHHHSTRNRDEDIEDRKSVV